MLAPDRTGLLQTDQEPGTDLLACLNHLLITTDYRGRTQSNYKSRRVRGIRSRCVTH